MRLGGYGASLVAELVNLERAGGGCDRCGQCKVEEEESDRGVGKQGGKLAPAGGGQCKLTLESLQAGRLSEEGGSRWRARSRM